MTTTNTTAHANCSHAATKSARAACRKARAAVSPAAQTLIDWVAADTSGYRPRGLRTVARRARLDYADMTDRDLCIALSSDAITRYFEQPVTPALINRINS